MTKGKLGERLISMGIISPDQLELALKEQKRTGKYLGEVINALGFATQEAIQTALAMQSGVNYINLKDHLIDPEAIRLVPESFAREKRLVPLSVEGDNLSVAMANVFDLPTIDALQQMTGHYIDVNAASENDIQHAIDQYYGNVKSLEEIIQEAVKVAQAKEGPGLGDDVGAAPIIRLVDHLIMEGTKQRATDIHIEPERQVVRTRFRIDGILQQGISLPKILQSPLIARIKIMAGMNIAESRVPQDGRILFHIGNRTIDLRVSSMPTIYGEDIVLRLLDKENLILGLDKLGFSPEHIAIYRQQINRPHGIILVTGPTGSGKTTTLYSTLSHINNLERSIITLEDPVEYELTVIRQTQINPKAGLTFANGLRSILRHDPDIIFIGEMRDSETADMAIRSALTGHLVLSTLHTNDAVGSIPRLLNMGVEAFLLASALNAVIAQRLVRIICPNCKTPYTPEKRLLKRFGLSSDSGTTFYHGSGCPSCGNTGFRGRIGIFEVLTVSSHIESLIMEKHDPQVIKEAALSEGFTTMEQDGIRKAKQGITTLEEVERVVA